MRALAIGILLLVATMPAMAQDCVPTTTNTPLVCHAAVGCVSNNLADRYYVQWDRCAQFCSPFLIHVYEETNGIPGLQRSDDIADDTCGGEIAADTIVFR